MSVALHLGPEQETFISSLSNQLAINGGEIRITGEPGSGKTRLVLETIRRDVNLQRKLLYYEDPADFLDEPYLSELSLVGNESTHLIVVDDCHTEFYASTRSQIAAIRDRVVFVTITHDHAADAITAPPLPAVQIAAILGTYRNDLGTLTSEYVECCHGSPRFAHLVGESLKSDTGSIVSHPDANRIVERIICGKAGTGNAESHVRLTVARFTALFDRFGAEAPYTAEVESVASWIAQLHPSIGLGDVLQAVHQLRSIRVLQGKRTVYFVPPALRWHLWRQWWRIYGATFKVKQIESQNDELRSWFIRNLERSPEISTMREIASRSLRFDEWFYHIQNHDNRWGASLFRTLGEFAPKMAVVCIERILLHQDEKQRADSVRSKTVSVAVIIDVLEYASMWQATALSAIRILRDLALAEADENGHATKTFYHFFTLGSGTAAATEMEPSQRFTMLDEMLLADVTTHRILGLQACAAVLDRHRPGRSLGWNRRGSRERPRFWVPGSNEEYFGILLSVWVRLCDFVNNTHNDDTLSKAWDVVGSAFHSLVQQPELAEHCIRSIEPIATNCAIELTKPLLDSVVGLWRVATNLPEPVRRDLETLYKAVVFRTFETRLKRFVGMGFFGDDRTLSFDYPPLDDVSLEIQRLASESLTAHVLLRPHLQWMLTSADRAWGFGLELGIRDVNGEWKEEIFANQRNRLPESNTAFIGGYLEAIRRRSASEFAMLMQDIGADTELRVLLPAVVSRTGGIIETIGVITQLMEKEEISVETLSNFRYIHKSSEIPEATFSRWIELLRKNGGSDQLGLALDFLYGRYLGESVKPFPAELVADLLAMESVIKLVKGSRKDRNNDDYHYHWGKLLELVTANNEMLAVSVVREFFESFLDKSHSSVLREGNAIDQSVWKVLELQPEATWAGFFDVLLRSKGKSTYELFHWLGGNYYYIEGANPGLWPNVPEEMLWDWIDRELPTRADFVARELPPLVTEHGLTAISCSFIRRYSGVSRACDSLIGSRVSGIVKGSYADFNHKRLEHAIVARSNTTDPLILIWLNRHIEELTADVERRSSDDEDNERGQAYS